MSEFDEKTSDFLSRLGIFHNHPAGKKLCKDFSTFRALKKAQPSLDDLLKLGFSNFEANLIRKKIQPKVQPKAEEKAQEKNQKDNSDKNSQQKVETKSEVNPQKTETCSESKPQKVEQKAEVKSEDKSQSSPSSQKAVKTEIEEKSQLKVDDKKPQTEPKSENSQNNKPPDADQKPEIRSKPSEEEHKQQPAPKVDENTVKETAIKAEPKSVENVSAKVDQKPTVQKVDDKPVKNVEIKLEEKPVTNTAPKVEERTVTPTAPKVEEPVKILQKEEENRKEISLSQAPQTSSEKSQNHIIEEAQPLKSKEGPLQIKVIQEPQTKIVEKSDRWIILAALPGSKSDKIEVVVNDDILSIRAPLISTETTKRLSLYEKKIRIPQYIVNHPKLSENPLETTVQYDRGLLVIEIKKPEFARSQPKVSQNSSPFTLSSAPLSDKNRTSAHSVSVPIKNNNQVNIKKTNSTQKQNENISPPKKIQIPNTKVTQPKEEHPVPRSKPRQYSYSRKLFDVDDFAKEIDSFFNDDFFSTRKMFGVPPVSTFPWFDTDPLHPPAFTRPFFRSNIPFSFF